MTVGELQERMSQREFIYWQVFHARRVRREETEANRMRRR